VEQIDAAIAKQWSSKHISAETDGDATTEDEVFSMQPIKRANWTSQ
jgi:hypothetical protein